jgi:hypothetical protein
MIASEALRLQREEDLDDGDNHLPEEDYEETRLPQSFLNSLTLVSSTYLSQILSALAAHVPLAEKSMQNRIQPIGWEGVLDIVAVSGLVDPKSVSDTCNTSLCAFLSFVLYFLSIVSSKLFNTGWNGYTACPKYMVGYHNLPLFFPDVDVGL